MSPTPAQGLTAASRIMLVDDASERVGVCKAAEWEMHPDNSGAKIANSASLGLLHERCCDGNETVAGWLSYGRGLAPRKLRKP
jgi:hypothetical protein